MQTLPQRSVRWVDWRGNPISGGMTANLGMESTVRSVAHGETLGNVEDLLFRDSGYFRAGELHNHLDLWRAIIGDFPSPQESEIFHTSGVTLALLRVRRMSLIVLQGRRF